jgi:hypothetical protein
LVKERSIDVIFGHVVLFGGCFYLIRIAADSWRADQVVTQDPLALFAVHESVHCESAAMNEERITEGMFSVIYIRVWDFESAYWTAERKHDTSLSGDIINNPTEAWGVEI